MQATTELTAGQLAEQYTAQDVERIVAEAKDAAQRAASVYEQEHFPNGGWGACGFAWVNIYGIKGNTKIGKRFALAGVRKDYTGALQRWKSVV